MNIYMQICGLAILLVIMVILRTQKEIRLKSQRYFKLFLVINFINLGLDGLSIIAINHYDSLGALIVEPICKLYLMSLVVMAFMSYTYYNLEIDARNVIAKRIRKASIAFLPISMLIIASLPISYYCKDGVVYTYNLAVECTYLSATIYLLLNFFSLLFFTKYIGAKRRAAGFIWLSLWVGAAVIQFLNNELLVVGFAGALGVSILFMRLENPNDYLDRETSVLNMHALFLNLRELDDKISEYGLVIIDFEIQEENLTYGQRSTVMTEIAGYLEAIEQGIVYKGTGSQFILLVEDKNEVKAIIETLNERFNLPWGDDLYVKTRLYGILECSSDFDNTFKNIQNFIAQAEKESNRIALLDEAWIFSEAEKQEIFDEISEALENDRIEVYYQPIYSVEKKSFVSAEALIRIIDSKGKIMYPNVFIPVAESRGRINQLGEMLFRKVCRFISQNDLQKLGVEYIDVNVSTIQSGTVGFAESFISIMEEYNINPRWINLEITESSAIKSQEIVNDNIQKLLQYGCWFSLDDFGTGYSNLNYILQLPVEVIKFDREMTMAYFESEKGRSIMLAAVSMIKALDFKIVSEGVETEEQLKEVETLGIGYVQGYVFAKPMEEKAYLEFLKNREEHYI